MNETEWKYLYKESVEHVFYLDSLHRDTEYPETEQFSLTNGMKVN